MVELVRGGGGGGAPWGYQFQTSNLWKDDHWRYQFQTSNLWITDQSPCQTLEGGKEVVLPWPVGLDPPHSIRTMVENVIVLVMIIFCAPKNHVQWE